MLEASATLANEHLEAVNWYLHPFVQEGEVAAHLDTGLGFQLHFARERLPIFAEIIQTRASLMFLAKTVVEGVQQSCWARVQNRHNEPLRSVVSR